MIISTWYAELIRAVLTDHNNAAAEAVNRLVKFVYRTAYGFRNVTTSNAAPATPPPDPPTGNTQPQPEDRNQ